MMQQKPYTLTLYKKTLIVTKEGLSLVQHSTLGRILVSKGQQPNHTSLKEKQAKSTLRRLSNNIKVLLTSMDLMSKHIGGIPETNDMREIHLNLPEASSSGPPLP